MKVLFLDIDGVMIVKQSTVRRTNGGKGISDTKLKMLKQIVDRTGAEIVLVSSWKKGWDKDETKITDIDALYLLDRFRKYKLTILDKTTEDFWFQRGLGIHNWLCMHKDVTSWAVLDDEMFDYGQYGIMERLVQTESSDFNGGGLQQRHVEKVLAILNLYCDDK